MDRLRNTTALLLKSYVLSNIRLPLRYYGYNVTSTDGENGILEEIFRRLKISKGFFVEFGANDGKSQSNTYTLLAKSWTGLYIEGDSGKFESLVLNVNEFKGVKCVYKFISLKNGNRVDDILRKSKIKDNFDLLSMDIDGNDYWIWKALTYKPKVVVIEYNSSLGLKVSKSIPYNPLHSWDGTMYFGASALAMINLGIRKGYSLISSTQRNLIFLLDELMNGKFQRISITEVKSNIKRKPTNKKFIDV